jgi:hypothetical protein
MILKTIINELEYSLNVPDVVIAQSEGNGASQMGISPRIIALTIFRMFRYATMRDLPPLARPRSTCSANSSPWPSSRWDST